MRINLVLPKWSVKDDETPGRVIYSQRLLIERARSLFGGVVLRSQWGDSDVVGVDVLTLASFLSYEIAPLTIAIRGLPVGALNPVELAEQLATVDHACAGRISAGIVVPRSHVLMQYGIDASDAVGRFHEALELMRAMWQVQPIEGRGPHYVFSSVGATLVPFSTDGPPLALEVADRDGAVRAAGLGLGLHVRSEVHESNRVEMLTAYREHGGSGATGFSCQVLRGTYEILDRWSEEGFDEVDVELPLSDNGFEGDLREMEALAEAVSSM